MGRLSLRSPAAMVLAASAFMAVPGNLPLWAEFDSLGLGRHPGGWLLGAAFAVLVTGLIGAILSLFAWRRTLKPAIVLLLLITAVTSHFMLRYHVVMDSGMLTNTLQTDTREATALLDWSLLPVVLLLFALPAWLVWRWPVEFRGARAQAARNVATAVGFVVIAIGMVLVAFQPFSSTMRNHKQLRYLMNPLNTLYAAGQLAAAPLAKPKGALQPLGLDARVAATARRPALLVLVLGETGRSGNFSINGYARDTTPELRAAGVATFTDAWSCGTSTAASVPCMFSHLGRDGFDSRSNDSENLMDVLQHAGLAVLWIDNQAGCKGVCDRIPHASTTQEKDSALCHEGECFDEIMLKGLQQRIDALPAERRAKGVVVVMHQMGSHGPAYWLRSPPAYKRFQPECRSVNLQDCSREEVVNAYDNTIAYTDHMLAQAIAWLKERTPAYDTAMLYLADHGESLGEKSLYLHGLPWSIAPDEQKHVPWITWVSQPFASRAGVTMDCLKARASQHVTHDNLFHSVLGLMQVSTAVYRKDLDAYAGCATP